MAHAANRPVVLIAEDEVVLRNLIRRTLELAGFDVLSAADGLEALALSREFKGQIDVLVTDFDMPNMDGGALVSAIRAEHPEWALILMSGGRSEAELDELSVPVLMKPFQIDDLVKIVNAECSRSRAV